MTQADVIVVGSGPAGAHAAYRLAEAGLDTVVLEKRRLPRYKTCGGGVVAAAAAMLPVDIGPVTERECHLAVLTDWDSGRRVEVSHSRPLVYMTMRDRFDSYLVNAACGKGVRLVSPCAVLDVEQTSTKVTITTEVETFVADYVIGADGAAGIVAAKAGFRERPECIPALEWEIAASPSELEQFGSIRLDLGSPRNGYSWVFPKRSHLSVGLLSFGSGRQQLKARLSEYLAGIGLGGNSVMEQHAYVIPVRPRPEKPGRGRVLLAGDSIGLANPITCEGISPAIFSGALAARAIVQSARHGPDAVRNAYEHSLKTKLLPQLARARLLVPVVYRHPLLRRVLLGPFGRIFARKMVWTAPGTEPVSVRQSVVSRPSHAQQ